jgi:hypothetical protein
MFFIIDKSSYILCDLTDNIYTVEKGKRSFSRQHPLWDIWKRGPRAKEIDLLLADE